MEKESTVEVDADELSDEVIESLVEEGGIDEDEAREMGDEVWFEEMDVGDGNRTGLLSYLKGRYETGVSIASSIKDTLADVKTTRAKVESVERYQEDSVKITTTHSRIHGSKSFVMDHDSDVLANLMIYKGVSNPKDLVGCDLFVLPQSLDTVGSPTVLIPHNVSLTGRLRFRLYSLTREVSEKSRISMLEDSDEGDFGAFMGTTFITTIFAMIGLIIYPQAQLIGTLMSVPFAICALVFVFMLVYAVSHIGMVIVYSLFHSDFEEL